MYFPGSEFAVRPRLARRYLCPIGETRRGSNGSRRGPADRAPIHDRAHASATVSLQALGGCRASLRRSAQGGAAGKIICMTSPLFGRDFEVAVGLLKAKRSLARPGGRELVGTAGSLADPKRPHEFEARQPFQILGVPVLQLRVLGPLANDGVFHNRIAEVVDDCCDGEDAAQPLVQTFLRRGLLGLRGSVIGPG